MPALPVFTERDVGELRRMKRRLHRLPRVRVRTMLQRATAQAAVRLLEAVTGPDLRAWGLDVETRRVTSRGRRLRLRIIRPPGPLRGVHLDLHGGSWCLGSARMDDRPNGELARACNVAVVSVDYGLAPRTPLAEILAQCDAAAAWLAENAAREFRTSVLTIGGESAGAHLALCTLAKRRSAFRAALLFYGVYDLAGSDGLRAAAPDTLVMHAPSGIPSLHLLTPGMTDEDRRAPELSPLFADLEGMPPVLVVCGTDDPLLGENEALRARWHRANANADVLLVPEAPHAFNRLPIAVARKAEGYARAWLSERVSAVSQ